MVRTMWCNIKKSETHLEMLDIISVTELFPEHISNQPKRSRYYRIVFRDIPSYEVISVVNNYHGNLRLLDDGTYCLDFRTSGLYPNDLDEYITENRALESPPLYKITSLSVIFDRYTTVYPRLSGLGGMCIEEDESCPEK